MPSLPLPRLSAPSLPGLPGLGVPVTLTPQSALPVILGVLSPATGATTLTMTNVVADQPITLASSMLASGLLITTA